MGRVVHVPLSVLPPDVVSELLRVLSEDVMAVATCKVADLLKKVGRDVPKPSLVYLAFRDDPAVKETLSRAVRDGVDIVDAINRLCSSRPDLCILVLEYGDE